MALFSTDEYGSGYEAYPSPEAEFSKDEEEKDQASWLGDFESFIRQPGFMLGYSSAKSVDRSEFDRNKQKIWDARPTFLGLTLAEADHNNLDKLVRDHGDDIRSFLNSSSGEEVDASGAPGSGGLAPSTVDYLYSDLAKHYGMDASTAYQEALSNTAYQRAVADMKRAGLNPASIFGAGRGQTAGGVGYVGSTNSGYGYSQDDQEYGLSKSAYSLITGLLGVGAVALLKGIRNPYVRFLIGTSAAKGLAGLIGVSQGK